MDNLLMVSYGHPSMHCRFRQWVNDPLPAWAVDIRNELPTDEERQLILAILGL